MPALNFQKQFVDKILSGEKTQTIRATRKRSIVQGDKLYLYTGMRTKSCKKLFDTECFREMNIKILENGDLFLNDIQGNCLCKESIAVDDGFETFDKMYEWFKNMHGFPFEGQLIKWIKEE